jgi:hypothetical protein
MVRAVMGQAGAERSEVEGLSERSRAKQPAQSMGQAGAERSEVKA